MNNQELTSIIIICEKYSVEKTFVDDLLNEGLIECTFVDEQPYLHHDYLDTFEKIIRIHRDLQINIQGIDVVLNLLNKMEAMQEELNETRLRLGIYERNEEK